MLKENLLYRLPFVGLILNQLASVYHALLQTKTKSVNIREKNEVADLYDCCVSSQLSRDETF